MIIFPKTGQNRYLTPPLVGKCSFVSSNFYEFLVSNKLLFLTIDGKMNKGKEKTVSIVRCSFSMRSKEPRGLNHASCMRGTQGDPRGLVPFVKLIIKAMGETPSTYHHRDEFLYPISLSDVQVPCRVDIMILWEYKYTRAWKRGGSATKICTNMQQCLRGEFECE